MVFYVKEISTAANTSQYAAIKTDARIWAGVIHRVEVQFPPGPTGLLHVTIWHGGHQIFPSEELMDFASDDETIAFNDFYRLVPGDNKIVIRTWNEDTVHAHEVRVRIGVMPEFLLNPQLIFADIANSLRKLLRRIGIVV